MATMRRKAIQYLGALVIVGLLLVILGWFPALIAQVFGIDAPGLNRVSDILVTVGLVLMFALSPLGAWLWHKESQNFKGFAGPKRYGNTRHDKQAHV